MITGVRVGRTRVYVAHCAFTTHSFLLEPTGN